MKSIIIYLLLISVIALPGCDSLLEIDSKSDISNANYWKAESDVKGYINGIYNSFRSKSNSLRYGEERSDNMKPGQLGVASTSIWGNIISPSNGYSWVSFYSLIHDANLVLSRTPGISFRSANEKNYMLGQAHWFRAKAYLTLIQTWGDVPIVLEPSESAKMPKNARSAASKVMNEVILPDIEQALTLITGEAIANRNLISRAATHCLKAEALAWRYCVLAGTEQDLRDGIDAINQVDKGSVATLLSKDDYSKIFAVNNKKNSEIIFSLYLKNLEFTGMYINLVIPDEQTLTDIINKPDIPHGTGLSSRSEFAPSDELQARLSKYTGDVRKNASFVHAYNSKNVIVVTSQNKFKGSIIDQKRVYEDDIIIYRLADMILLKAEMQANLGGAEVSNAITSLNRIRNRAGIGDYLGPTDQPSVQREILDERARELCFELKRWPDLLRAHSNNVIDIYTVVPQLVGKTTPLYLPITKDMQALNPNLEQTNGY